MALENLQSIIGLLSQGGEQGNMRANQIPNIEITPEVRENFQVVNPAQQAPQQTPQQQQAQTRQPGQQVLKSIPQAKVNPGGFDLSVLPGTQIEGMTAKGIPEPEELTGLGKAFRDFANVIQTPGAQQLLANLGIAFAQGQEGQPGTILGNAALQGAEGEMQRRLVSGLLQGQTVDQIDLGGGRPSPETVQSAMQIAQAQEGLGLRERELDQQGEQFEQTEERLTAQLGTETAQTQQRLNQYADQIGLARDEFNLDVLKFLAEQQSGNIPDDVSSTDFGLAQKIAATTFLDAARNSFAASNPQLAGVQEIMNALSTENIGIDPTKVRAQLPDALKQEFDNFVTNIAKSVTRAGSQPGTLGGLDLPTSVAGAFQRGLLSEQALEASFDIPTVSSQDRTTFDQMDEGSLLRLEGMEGIFVKRGGVPTRLRQQQTEE